MVDVERSVSRVMSLGSVTRSAATVVMGAAKPGPLDGTMDVS